MFLYSVASGENYKFKFTAKVSSQNGLCPTVTWEGAKDAVMSKNDDLSMLVELKDPVMDEDLIVKAKYEANDTPYIVVEPGQKGITWTILLYNVSCT